MRAPQPIREGTLATRAARGRPGRRGLCHARGRGARRRAGARPRSPTPSATGTTTTPTSPPPGCPRRPAACRPSSSRGSRSGSRPTTTPTRPASRCSTRPAAQTRYVRAEAPRGAPVRFDHGTWSAAGGFASAGATTGEAVAGPGGSVTIDVPARRAGDGAHAPVRADLRRRHRRRPALGRPRAGRRRARRDRVRRRLRRRRVRRPAGRAPGRAAAPTTTAVVLDAPPRLVGGGRTALGGRVVPARAGVAVAVTATARRARAPARRHAGRRHVLAAAADRARPPASAPSPRASRRRRGRSPCVSTVRIRVRRSAGGAAVIRGRVRPRLPGRVLLLRGGAVRPTATAQRPRRALPHPARQPAPRPLPGRLHPVRRARRAVHVEHRSHPMKSIRIAGALAAVAGARRARRPRRAHPSVYTDTAPGRAARAAGRPRRLTQTRYVVANHGFTYVLRESNGGTDRRRASTTSRCPRAYRDAVEPGPGMLARPRAHGRAGARDVRASRRSRRRRRSALAGRRTRSTTTSRSRRSRPAWRTTRRRGSRSCKDAHRRRPRDGGRPAGRVRGAARSDGDLRRRRRDAVDERGASTRADRARDAPLPPRSRG